MEKKKILIDLKDLNKEILKRYDLSLDDFIKIIDYYRSAKNVNLSEIGTVIDV